MLPSMLGSAIITDSLSNPIPANDNPAWTFVPGKNTADIHMNSVVRSVAVTPSPLGFNGYYTNICM